MRNPAAASSSRPLSPSRPTSSRVSSGPAIDPILPPAAISANSRVACAAVNISTIRLQNTEIMNRLATLNQT